MLSQQSLYKILNIEISPKSAEILIYAEQQTERLSYVCEFIFKHVLKLNFRLYTQLNDFENQKGLKLNYSSKFIPQAFQIIPNGLLEQKGILEQRPIPDLKNNILYFYPTESLHTYFKDCLHFDIFSSIFYLISRYEEWQHYTPDAHGRFEVEQSSLFKNSFHLKPLVEIWILELKTELQKLFPDFVFPETQFQVLSTIDVDNLYAFKSKGILRTLGAGIKDILKGDLTNLSQRIRVLTGKLPDPFDIYESVSDFCFEKKIPLIYFFLFKTGDTHNRTVDPDSGAFKNVFSSIRSNHAHIAIHPSYNASIKNELLEKELTELTKQSGQVIGLSRQHYLRFDIRTTPNNLLKHGIFSDFTMGYASQAGFRAGTSHPFHYYDFNSEKRTELLFVPFCVMDGAYTIYKNASPKTAYKQMLALAQEVKKVNGLFITVFHERSFSDHLYPGFGTLYKKLHTQIKAL
jgi:hypothetical protein